MPRECLIVAPHKLELRECPEPEPAPDQVKVRMEHGAAKHGTEMALYKGYFSDHGDWDPEYQLHRQPAQGDPYPFGAGNTCVGVVEQVGDEVDGIKEGDRVFRFSHFREVACWPADGVRVLPEGVSWKAATCIDPADFAMGAVRDGHVRIGDAVAVIGLGAIGQFAVQLAKMAGAYPVIGADLYELRRRVAADCGADVVLDPRTEDVGLRIKEQTGKRGADVCIDFSGSDRGLHAAIRGVAYGGTVVAGSFPSPGCPDLDLGAEAHLNRPTIVFSRACSEPNPDHPRWDERRIVENCWWLLKEGRLECEQIVQPVVPFDEVLAHYPKIESAPETNLKLGVEF
jgi:threonine dehydrogenase-like Zn-dependent dehydrogenase